MLKHYKIHIISIGIVLLLLFQLALPQSIAFAGNQEKQTTLGGVPITSTKESTIQSELSAAIAEWKKEPIIVTGKTGFVEIPTEMIQFDLEGTVQNYLKESKAPWYMPWKKRKIVHLPLALQVADEVDALLRENPFFKVEETRHVMSEHASYLKADRVEAVEGNLTKEHLERTAFEIQPISQSRTSLSSLVTMLDGMVLAENEIFSFLEKTEEIASSTDIEAKRFFASVLYSVVLQSETSIVERHSQNKIPTYLQAGIEVDVSERLQKDFAFQNSSTSPMLFGAKIENNNLLIDVFMPKQDKTITYSVVEKKVEPKTIYRLSSELRPNQSKVIESGKPGYRVTVNRIFQDGAYEQGEEVSRDFYAPVHKVIQVSSREVETNQSSNDSNNNETTEDSSEENDSEHTNDGNKQNDNGNKEESNENEQDDERKEIIYDKGGNVIEDPNN